MATDGEKNLKIRLFVSTERTNVTDRRTHRQTPHDDIGRAYASHRAAKITIFDQYRFISELMQDRAIVTMEGE